MLMRVAIGIHKNDIESAIETYKFMSLKYFTHATPTLFNGGTPNPQMSSCFLLSMKEDSIDGIYDTLKRCALVSKAAGFFFFKFYRFNCLKLRWNWIISASNSCIFIVY